MTETPENRSNGQSWRDKGIPALFIILVLLVLVTALALQRVVHIARRLDEQEKRIVRLESTGNPNQAAPTSVQVSYSDDWIGLGRADAPVTIIEFTDYECPFCRQFHQGAFAEIMKEYVDPGKVRWVSRDLPLEIHPYARKSAEAAHCARDQGKFWEFRDALLSAEKPLSRQLVRTTAAKLSLDTEKLLRCVDSSAHRDRVANDIADARVLQIDGTPAFVLARSSRDLLAGSLIVGAAPLTVFQKTIDSLLTEASAGR